MLCRKVVLLVLIATSIPQISNHPNENNVTLRRKRQDDDRWSWGYISVPDTNPPPLEQEIYSVFQRQSENTNPKPVEVNPCQRPLITMPKFNTLGRRKSETKCLEYIWDIRLRMDKDQRTKECIEYSIRENERLMNGVKFAIGGREAYPGEFPHMAALGWQAVEGSWIFKCGGSLISNKFVLTAAHCTKASPADTTITDVIPKIVRMGDRNIIDKFSNGHYPNDRNISRIIVHPQYKSPKKYYDVALLELKVYVQFKASLQPACLWSNFDTSRLGTEAKVTGWGVVKTASRTISPTLQVISVDFIDSPTCDTLLRPNCNRNWCGIQDHQICAGKLAGGVDACQGDSGGPMQVKINLPQNESSIHYVIGITSFGFSCALPDTPGVYTRVSAFIDWIESVVWP